MSSGNPKTLEPTNTAPGCLDAYQRKQREKSLGRLPECLATEGSDRFAQDIERATELLSRWKSGAEGVQRDLCSLMLGKVQSGKTKHLLGMMAWAVDSRVDVVAMFTGVTQALLTQTKGRIEDDLGHRGLSRPFINVVEVPTQKSARFAEVKRALLGCVESRRRNQGSSTVHPMPVLLAMKNSARLKALKALLASVRDRFGDNTSAMLIDDEADQASPNALTRQREIAQIYRQIADARKVIPHCALLSYTATPQAIWLTDRDGWLRPHRCRRVRPGHGYYGLARVFEQESPAEVAGADDWDAAQHLQPGAQAPGSLRKALAHFYVAAWVRMRCPEAFYLLRAQGVSAPGSRSESVQMLVHESAQVDAHRLLAQLVGRETTFVQSLLADPASSAAQEYARDYLLVALKGMRGRLPENLREAFPDNLEKEDLVWIYELLVGSTEVREINGRGDRLPGGDADWERKKAWILVGGNILGRGVTIPQLVTTYFVRSAQNPNYDTVAQQLRFCGYRGEYEHMLHLSMPSQTREDLLDMRHIEDVTWRKAGALERDDVNLQQEPPRCYYVAPGSARVNPTRSGVIDSRITVHDLSGTLFSAREAFNPLHASANARNVAIWAKERAGLNLGLVEPGDADWILTGHLDPSHVRELLVTWRAPSIERQNLRDVADVFEGEMGELGLANVPVLAAIRFRGTLNLLASPSVTASALQGLDQRSVSSRAVSGNTDGANLENWVAAALGRHGAAIPDLRMSTPYIGDAQRAVQNRLHADCTVVLIEPVLAVEDGRDPASRRYGVGLALAVLAPQGYSVRLMGHQVNA